MLRHISIRNFAIIDELTLDLENGMTTLTGETGAGKSILLDAIGLVLGDRADTSNVRHGSDKADISASFETETLTEVSDWLKENDLDNDDECILRRVVSTDGRSKGYINGAPVTVQQLKTVGEMLIDIHGQHEHQSLMRTDIQRRLLDDYAGHADEINQLATSYQQWFDSEEQYRELETKADQRNERLELLRFQVQELELLQPQPDEYAGLSEEHDRLAHVDNHMATCNQVSKVLYDDETSLHTMLMQQIHAIEHLNSEDKTLSTVVELLNDAQTQLSEAASQTRHYLDKLEVNPERLTEVEQRLSLMHDQARKHRVEPEQLPELYQQLSEEFNQLEHADESLDKLKQERDQFKQHYLKLASALSKKRIKAAKTLSNNITKAMQTLNMTGGQFEIRITQAEPLRCSAEGFDAVEFLVSANPGQPPKPLAKVASGGELARISLAIQMITAKQGRIPTLIFDEVDSGVGGATAEVVGKHLRILGNERQILCVTHLPQVASQAHHHLQVNKTTSDNHTITQIKPLLDNARIEEIARMLGGVNITEQTRMHAEEMISNAQSA